MRALAFTFESAFTFKSAFTLESAFSFESACTVLLPNEKASGAVACSARRVISSNLHKSACKQIALLGRSAFNEFTNALASSAEWP